MQNAQDIGSELAVEMTGISRRFGAVLALDSVSLKVKRGEIHAVIGENGAGKTTLMRILYGADRPNEGSIKLNGHDVRFRSASEGIAAGIGMVSQHYSIIPELTCLENLMLGAEPSAIINMAEAEHRAESLAQQMEFSFAWKEPAETLSPSAAQKLEILKLLWRNSRIMILDEPTAMLSPADSDGLYASLKKLAKEGATILVVTHRLPEILEHCDRATVLRGGKFITETGLENVNSAQLAALIVGNEVPELSQRPEIDQAPKLLECRELSVLGHRGNVAVKSASFSVRNGEILGIAGVDGSGQRELFWALCGVAKCSGGQILFEGANWAQSSTRDRLSAGLRLIPEDRHEEGIVDSWSLDENASLGLQHHPDFHAGMWMKTDSRTAIADRMAKRFSTRHGGLHLPIESLSGGNQQRFVAARALETGPKLILAFQPARGLDIQASRAVNEAIASRCNEGACAIIVSFDLDELLESCDRIGVMCNGTYTEPPAHLGRDRAAIGRLMVGAQ